MARESKEKVKARAERVVELLRKYYPESKCSLYFRNPLELLIATILSAQCTDERVNKVTPALFDRFKNVNDFADAEISEIENYIKSTNFFRNKAKNIKAAAEKICNEHKGEVPQTIEALSALPGVGRKTANVVLGNAFDTPGLVVDTHVGRLSRRLGFTENTDAVKVEFDLMEIIRKEDWSDLAHLMIDHGRAICTARRAECERCFLNAEKLCPRIGVDKKTGRPIDLDDKNESKPAVKMKPKKEMKNGNSKSRATGASRTKKSGPRTQPRRNKI